MPERVDQKKSKCVNSEEKWLLQGKPTATSGINYKLIHTLDRRQSLNYDCLNLALHVSNVGDHVAESVEITQKKIISFKAYFHLIIAAVSGLQLLRNFCFENLRGKSTTCTKRKNGHGFLFPNRLESVTETVHKAIVLGIKFNKISATFLAQ